MGYSVSIPKVLYKDKKLKDFDIRLYLIIAEHVNEHGYSRITNDTLTHLIDKKETAIRDALKNLVKAGYLHVKLNAKQNEMYPQDFKRVIWLIDPYNTWRNRLKKEREKERKKSIENDKRLFIAWLRADCKGIRFPVNIGGLTQNYAIELSNHGKYLMYLYPTGEERIQLEPHESQEVFDRMWMSRQIIFKVLRTKAQSKTLDELTKLANEKNEND